MIQAPPQPSSTWSLRENLAALAAEASLYAFVKAAWPILEPATPFIDGWHIRVICEHLEAVSAGRIRRLVINIPPRHAKSLLVAVFWPCWVWATRPATRWLFTSYSQDLSIRDSNKCRNLINSAWYQHYWSRVFTLSSEQNAKKRFDNTLSGYRIASSVAGLGTGEGADFVVADDPHNVKEADSDLKRESVLRWWRETMSSRLNRAGRGAFVIVQQRVHQEDLAGAMLASGRYEHLCLPARYEPDRRGKTCLGAYDQRTQEGELLWPDGMPEDELTLLEADMGSFSAAGQLQQRPAPRGGGLFKRDWWGTFAAPLRRADLLRVIQVWDTAQKTGSRNDYSVCTTWARTAKGLAVLDCWREKVEFPALKRQVETQADRWHPAAIYMEDKNSGTSILQELKRDSALPLVAVKVEGDKVQRARAATPYCESGRVALPVDASGRAPDWVALFVDQHADFPATKHDDIVDTTSMAIKLLILARKHRSVKPRGPMQVNRWRD